MIKLKFYGHKVEVQKEIINDNLIDIDFNGCLMVRFENQIDGTFKPINAVDGWGNNCYQEIKNEKLEIEKL